MIGFFDSGFGGLTILKEVEKALPSFSYIYLGDNARTPYGSHSQEIIYQYTIEGVEELFRQGAKLVILACNTASAVALKKLQQEWLPLHYPDRRVLGIFNPTVEEAGAHNLKTIGLFATQATVESEAFIREIAKINMAVAVFQQACPLLVPIIETGNFDQLESVVQEYAQALSEKSNSMDAIILGCTHYAIVEKTFRKYLPAGIKIFSQGEIVAKKLKEYLDRHLEFRDNLKEGAKKIFLTTENSPHVQALAELFYGEKIDLFVISLG